MKYSNNLKSVKYDNNFLKRETENKKASKAWIITSKVPEKNFLQKFIQRIIIMIN